MFMRVAVLLKQVPKSDLTELDSNGRLLRNQVDLEMNPWCRRALATAVKLAIQGGGTCIAFTMGPPSAEAVAREAVAYGADEAVLITDPALAGSDTLVTARVLAHVLKNYAPFDLILTGKASTDSDTGQVAPELAQLLDLPFVPAAREIELRDGIIWAKCETDDGWLEASCSPPAIVACAERLSAPARVSESEKLNSVDSSLIHVMDATQLGPGSYGQEGSPTVVGRVRSVEHTRKCIVLNGTPAEQATHAVHILREEGMLFFASPRENQVSSLRSSVSNVTGSYEEAEFATSGIRVGVLLEPGRDYLNAELLESAAEVASQLEDPSVVAFYGCQDGNLGMDPGYFLPAACTYLVVMEGAETPEDMAEAVVKWLQDNPLRVLLAPSTTYGREVAARMGAGSLSGVAGDAIGLEVRDGGVVAIKPVFGGSLVAEIGITSPMQVVTVRPGTLSSRLRHDDILAQPKLRVDHIVTAPRRRIKIHKQVREVDIGAILSSEVLVCVGAGVDPAYYTRIDPLVEILGAQVVATRKVTDKGHLSRALQVGITGISVSPKIYVAIGVQGKTNHMLGTRGAGMVVALNNDPDAAIFQQCDIGMVGDWRELVPALHRAIEVSLKV